jgi:transcriptional regulator with XRE-family HTH domain
VRELRDPEFRAEWEWTALARWLVVEVAHYRAEHDLSQRQLAERLGVHQSDVARMETGEHTPSLERLVRVASGLENAVVVQAVAGSKSSLATASPASNKTSSSSRITSMGPP